MSKFVTKLLVFVLIVTALVVPTVNAQDGDPILIGTSLPITGTFSIAGSKHAEGYQLCVDQINEMGGLLGRPVEIIITDNRSDVDQAISQYERLINEDNVDLIFGTFSSRLTFPTSAIAEQNEMVNPIPAGGALRIYYQDFEYMFYFQQNAGELVGFTVTQALQDLIGEDSEDYPKTAALVHADDFFANGIAAGFLGQQVMDGDTLIADLAPGALAEAGIEAVFTETWPAEGFNDWTGLANSIRRSEAELLIGLTASPTEVIELTRALQTVGYQPKVAYFSQGTQLEYLEGVGEAVNGVLVHSSWHPNANYEGILVDQPFSNQDFVDLYTEEYGIAPDEDVAIPFSLCMGITQAVQAVGSTDNNDLRDWLADRTPEEPVKTILGDFSWNERGLPNDRAFLVLQWQEEELRFVYPVDEFPGTVEILSPKPEW
jgi:branched-chain amino acid transport system substrate-binding protein